MFTRLRSLIQGEDNLKFDTEGEGSSEELQVATGLILLEMAGRDGDFAPEEVQAVFAQMQDKFGLEAEEAKLLLERSQELLGNKEKLSSLVNSVNEKFSLEQRKIILDSAWAIVLADDTIERAEERFLEQLRNRLRVPAEE